MNGWTCIAQTHSHSKTYVDHYEFTNCTGGWGIWNEIEGLSFLGKHNNTLISRNKKPLHNSYLSEVLCTSAASCHIFWALHMFELQKLAETVLCSFSQLDSTRLDTKQVASTNDHLVWWTHAKLSYLWYFAGFLVGHAMFWLVSWQCSKFGIHDLQSFIQAPQSPHPQNFGPHRCVFDGRCTCHPGKNMTAKILKHVATINKKIVKKLQLTWTYLNPRFIYHRQIDLLLKSTRWARDWNMEPIWNILQPLLSRTFVQATHFQAVGCSWRCQRAKVLEGDTENLQHCATAPHCAQKPTRKNHRTGWTQGTWLARTFAPWNALQFFRSLGKYQHISNVFTCLLIVIQQSLRTCGVQATEAALLKTSIWQYRIPMHWHWHCAATTVSSNSLKISWYPE